MQFTPSVGGGRPYAWPRTLPAASRKTAQKPFVTYPQMRIVLANPRGFCAGVRMAIDVVDRVLDLYEGSAIHVYHEIVHNKHVVSRLRERGAVFVERIDEVPEGSIVVFSAHGVSPEVRKQAEARNLTAIDATCPLVTKVHAEAIRYSRQGFQILLVGHADHQEVIGTRGEAETATQVVETVADIDRLRVDDPAMLVYLTQTTLSTDDAAVIIDALKARFPEIKAPPSEDICYATTNRQHAVRTLAGDCDLVLVVGSTNSSNSKRLTEIAQTAGTRAHLIDDVSEIDPAWFTRGDETVLVTAGASAPENLVAGLCRHLVETFGATIETRLVAEEDAAFALPGALRRIMKDRGITGHEKPIRVGLPEVTADLYGTVPLSISAPTPASR